MEVNPNEDILNQIQLSDLLASYPAINTPELQTLISAKKEFNELASTPTEPPPTKRGEYFKHQLLVQRFLRAYRDLFIIHETGTGKTCSVVAFTEWVIEQIANGGNIRKIYAIVKGPTQKNEFKQQLACKCTDGR